MMNRLIEAVIAEQKYNTIRYILENNKKIIVQGVPIKSAATSKQYYSTTKRLAENIKTVLEL